MSRDSVLVLCTGNSCRSVMAEALVNALRGDQYEAFSAGSQPTGQINPGALATLERHGTAQGAPISESWDVYADNPFRYVITVCDSAAAEICPLFPGPAEKLHWGTPDPSHVTGTDAEIEAAFDAAFAKLKRHVEEDLP